MTKHTVQRSISEIIDVAASVPNVRIAIIKLDVVAHTCNPSTWGARARELRHKGQRV